MDKAEREKWYTLIYGPEYKPKGVDALPLSAYVRVDHMIHGCPIDEDELIRTWKRSSPERAPVQGLFSLL